MLPMRFDIEDATRVEAAAMMDVVKKMDPSLPSSRPNFRWKKEVTQELWRVSHQIFLRRWGNNCLQWYKTRGQSVQREQQTKVDDDDSAFRTDGR